jgi:hypothetical protein
MSGFTKTIDNLTIALDETNVTDTPTNSGNINPTIVTNTILTPTLCLRSLGWRLRNLRLLSHYHPCFPEEDQCSQCIEYPLYSDCCGSYFENKEQLDAHNQELCWDQHPQELTYCTCSSLTFETQEQLDNHNPKQCYATNTTTYECNCCGNYFYTHADFLAHDENQCWNEYTVSRMEEDRKMWDEWDKERQMLDEEERLADFKAQCSEEARELRGAAADKRNKRLTK